MARNIKVDGNQERNMERGRSGGQVVLFTKETGRMGRDTGKQDIITVVEAYMKEGTRTIRWKARECIHGQAAKDTKETGRMTKRMERECIHGQMAKDTKESTRITKRMDKEYWYGVMVHHTMVNGKMTSDTEKES